ncbi:Flp family type IVb pilin [Sphingomonas olei]
MQKMRAFLKNSKGATAIEYGLIAALIAVAAITAMGTLGDTIEATFGDVTAGMNQRPTQSQD